MKKLFFILFVSFVFLASCASTRVDEKSQNAGEKKNYIDESKYSSWILHETNFSGMTCKIRVPDESWTVQFPDLKISGATVVLVLQSPDNSGNMVLTAEQNIHNFSTEQYIELGMEQLKSLYPDLTIIERNKDSYSFYVTQHGAKLKMAQRLIEKPGFLFCITKTLTDENSADLVKLLDTVVDSLQIE